MRQFILATCLLGALPRFGAAEPAPATDVRLPVLARAATRIFVGTVRQLRYQPSPGDGLVYTRVSFSDLTFLKNRAGAKQKIVVLRIPGGRDADGTRVEVAGIPRFRLGERVLIFERSGASTFCPLVGWKQGAYRLARDPGRGVLVVLDADGAPVWGIRDGRLRSAATTPREPQSLFGAAVPHRGGSPFAAQTLVPGSSSIDGARLPSSARARRPRLPAITRITSRFDSDRAISPSPIRLAEAMPADELLAAVRRHVGKPRR
jgi:hypothetical protein